MNTLDTVYIGLIAFTITMAAIGIFYRHPKQTPSPQPYTRLRDPEAWQRNFESRWDG